MSVYQSYRSPLGKMSLYSKDGKQLWGVWFDGQKYDRLLIDQDENLENKEVPVLKMTKRWLDLYFNGDIPDFTPELAITGSSFKKEVLKILLRIPYGKTVTYKKIADMMNCRSAQAVGQAIAHNPLLIIIPCHRVIGTNGSLSGYAAGIARKKKLLALEGVQL